MKGEGPGTSVKLRWIYKCGAVISFLFHLPMFSDALLWAKRRKMMQEKTVQKKWKKIAFQNVGTLTVWGHIWAEHIQNLALQLK